MEYIIQIVEQVRVVCVADCFKALTDSTIESSKKIREIKLYSRFTYEVIHTTDEMKKVNKHLRGTGIISFIKVFLPFLNKNYHNQLV